MDPHIGSPKKVQIDNNEALYLRIYRLKACTFILQVVIISSMYVIIILCFVLFRYAHIFSIPNYIRTSGSQRQKFIKLFRFGGIQYCNHRSTHGLAFLIGLLKFIYSDKATKFCEISTLYLSYVVPVKSTEEAF